jgi:hypothetical protein
MKHIFFPCALLLLLQGCCFPERPISVVAEIAGERPDAYTLVADVDGIQIVFDDPTYFYDSLNQNLVENVYWSAHLDDYGITKGQITIWLVQTNTNDSLIILKEGLIENCFLSLFIYIGEENASAKPVFFHRNSESVPMQTLYWDAIQDTVRVVRSFVY